MVEIRCRRLVSKQKAPTRCDKECRACTWHDLDLISPLHRTQFALGQRGLAPRFRGALHPFAPLHAASYRPGVQARKRARPAAALAAPRNNGGRDIDDARDRVVVMQSRARSEKLQASRPARSADGGRSTACKRASAYLVCVQQQAAPR